MVWKDGKPGNFSHISYEVPTSLPICVLVVLSVVPFFYVPFCRVVMSTPSLRGSSRQNALQMRRG